MLNLTEYQKKALNYKQHISLTANAGSGKTFVLARRFLSILLEENISLSKIIAITFTDKAATELYKKIADEIDNRIENTENLSERKKLIALRRELVSAKISTIHSFCTDILREFPTEAGIDANFIPIDKRIADELISESIDEVLLNSLKIENHLSQIVKKNIRLFGTPDTLKAILTRSIHQRSTISYIAEKIYSESIMDIASYLDTTSEKMFKDIFGKEIIRVIASITEINKLVKDVSARGRELAEEVQKILATINTSENIIETVGKLYTILEFITTTSNTIKKNDYLPNKFRESVHEQIEFVENFYIDFKALNFDVNYNETTLMLAQFGKDFSELAKNILGVYSDKKLQKGYLDFEDLLLFAEKIVQRDDVKEFLAEKYEYFMIDEYQDTNETQYNIFIPILDYLKRGNLFIVGDDKQSIYMFRGADIKIFEKTKKIIKNSEDGTLLELPHSFRLSPKLTLFTNHLFKELFSNPRIIFNEVEYNELICAKPNSNEGEIAFLITDSSDDENDSEFELVAKQILTLVENEKINFGDIAILSRKRKSFPILEDTLARWNIPYRIYGGKGFYQRQEIYDVYNYLNFLINPTNDEALLAILRSPFFMLSDKIIFNISILTHNNFWDKTNDFARSNRIVNDVVSQLKKHIEDSKSFILSALIREILTSTKYYSKVLAKSDGEQIIQNLDKLINTAVTFINKGSVTIFDFVSYLKELIQSSEDESLANIDDSDNVVRLMTIHASKGLEFPVVFLVDTNSKGISEHIKSKSIAFDKEMGILTKISTDGYFDDYKTAPIVSLYNYIADKKSQAELKRLLYVAVTRAEKYLFISADSKIKRDGTRTLTNGSLLKLFANGLKLDNFDTPIILSGNQPFMFEENGNFLTKQEPVTIRIETKTNIQKEKKDKIQKENKAPNFNINTSVLRDTPNNEIISATKISVFNQCPLKYHLIYNLGYTSLFYSNKETSNIIEFDKEDDTENNLPANIRGSIIHKLLENGENAVTDLTIEQLIISHKENFNKAELKTEVNIIKEIITKFYSSKTYLEIKNFTNYYNEYEIYLRYKDFYLYGIIDKLIIDKNRAIIIDYKTDSLQKYSPKEKLENYKYQLLFYAFLINKMFPHVNRITCKLIFMEAPEEKAEIILSSRMLNEFESSMNEAVAFIRDEHFIKNKSHCKSCYFSDDNNNCVI